MHRHLNLRVPADARLQTVTRLLMLFLWVSAFPGQKCSPHVAFVHALHCLRYFVHLAMALPSLEPFVCNDLLKTACVSLAQVRSTDAPVRL